MKNMTIGAKVTAYKSQCIGCITDSSTFTGEVVKVNKKSIIVKLTHVLAKHGDKIVSDTEYNVPNVKYTYWKTTENGRIIYKSDSKIYGIIEFEGTTETTEEPKAEEQTTTEEKVVAEENTLTKAREELAEIERIYDTEPYTEEPETATETVTEPEETKKMYEFKVDKVVFLQKEKRIRVYKDNGIFDFDNFDDMAIELYMACLDALRAGKYEATETTEDPETVIAESFIDNSRYKKKHNAIVEYVKTQIGVDLNKYRDGDGTKPNMTTYYDLHERNKICINWKEIDRNTQNQIERLRGVSTEWSGAWFKYIYLNE